MCAPVCAKVVKNAFREMEKLRAEAPVSFLVCKRSMTIFVLLNTIAFLQKWLGCKTILLNCFPKYCARIRLGNFGRGKLSLEIAILGTRKTINDSILNFLHCR